MALRLMDKPVPYRGGPEQVFRRAESAAFFGREIGLMYVHAHLRYGEAMAALGEADALWEALQVANPIAVTDRLAMPRHASATPISAAATPPFPTATGQAEWPRVKAGSIPVDGGWRIYSSGPGLYTNLLLSHAFGIRRRFGERIVDPVLPPSLGRISVEMNVDGRQERWELAGKRRSPRRRAAGASHSIDRATGAGSGNLLALRLQANRRTRLSAVRASFNDVTRTPSPHAST